MTTLPRTLVRVAVTAGLSWLPFSPSAAQATAFQAASAASHGALPSSSKHMLFRVRGPNGATLYLLGSVHLLSSDAALPAQVDTAFEHAKTVSLEMCPDSVQPRAAELMMRGRFTNGSTLRSTLSASALPKVDSLLRSYGLTVDQVNGFKPWFVSMLLSQVAMQKMGFQPQYGVDMQLNARAKAAGKPVLGLESPDFQLAMFDGLSAADQEQMLVEGTPPDEAAKELATIRDAWAAGNTAALDSLLNWRLANAPGLRSTLLTNRNRNWIPKLEELIKGKEDALVVVGAGHLVGKEGVLEMLKAKGYTVEQM
jgi:uncharacterized protein YbaP (TraB family)